MGIRSMLRKVFGRDREDSPATSVPPQSREETVETGEAVTASETSDSATSATPETPVAPVAPAAPEEEARRAADDLVAASFDNPQVPKARKAEPEPEPVVAEEPTPVAPTEPEAVTEPATETAPATTSAPEEPEAVADAPEEQVAEEPEAVAATEDGPVTAPAPEEPEATAVEAPAESAETAVETPAEPEATTEAPVAEPQAETPAAVEEKAPEAEPQAEAPAEPAAAPAPEEQQAEQPTDTTDEPRPQAREAAPAEPETPAEPGLAEVTAPEAQAKPEAQPEPAEATAPEATPATAPEAPATPATAPEAPAPVPTPETPVITALEPEAPAAPVASAPEATGPALPLAKVKAVAPHLADAYKAAGTVLKKQGLDGARAAVYLVVDRSGSMRGYFKDGSVQRLAEQTVALAAHLDEDAAVTAVFFSTDIDGTAELTPATLSATGIEEINAGLGRLGRTHYHRAVEEVLAHHEKTDPTRPALVVFQTDGAPDAKTAATQALAGAADRPLHWRFVAWGEPDNKAFDYLRKLGGTPRTAAYFPGAAPAGTAHAAFYRGLLEGLEL
ncbi:VWA domain-containing protein [Streptomyces sp. NPDC090135]|uniref:VWA domain-containing protein n=1 Tax=Streptomyces sp. NPDC090135 TaxID=3365957 RepID=UPI00382CCEE8